MQFILTLLAFLLPITLSPGPATIALASTGMNHGFVRSMPFFCGLYMSAIVVAIAGGLGLNEILLSSPVAFAIIRYAGISYILYLAWKLFRARPQVEGDNPVSYGFLDGILLTALNPKYYVLITVFFSQFLKPGEGDLVKLLFGLGLILLGSQTIWLSIGVGLRPLLKSERALRIQTTIFGIMLAMVAVYLLVKDGF
ncbi:MAG: LysE family translocator [Rhizobiales bacterium]|nr:LysE family translocator [Hyphomicrobiales bacterium]